MENLPLSINAAPDGSSTVTKSAAVGFSDDRPLKSSSTTTAMNVSADGPDGPESVVEEVVLKKGTYDLSSLDMYPAAKAPEAPDLTKLPLEERLTSSKWNQRVHGYQELVESFKKAGPSTAPFNNHANTVLTALKTEKLTKAICEAMELVRAYAEFAPAPSCLEQLGSTDSLIKKIVKLTFTQNSLCLKKAYAAIFMLIEKNEEGGTDVAETLVSYFTKSQKYKIAVSAAGCLRESITLFGCGSKTVPFQPIVEKITFLFEHTSKQVRSEAEKLVVEMSRWTKTAAIFNFSSLKKIQQTDLTAAIEKAIGEGATKVPTRFTPKTFGMKIVAANTKINEEGESKTSSSAVVTEDNDLWKQMPAVSFNAALQKTNFYASLKEEKWKARHAGWESALKICGTSTLFRLEKEKFGDIFRAIKATLCNDSNMKVRVAALQLAGKLAAGARSNFSNYVKPLMTVLLSLFKEKHKLHRFAVDSCIDQLLSFSVENVNAIYDSCMSVDGGKNGYTGALHDANPLVRACTLEMLERYVSGRPETGKGNKWTESHKTLIDHVVEFAVTVGIADKVPECRDAACSLLSAAFTNMGDEHPSIASTIKTMEKKNPKLLIKIKSLCNSNGGGSAGGGDRSDNVVVVTANTSSTRVREKKKIKKQHAAVATSDSVSTSVVASSGGSIRSVTKNTSTKSNDANDSGDLVSLEEAKIMIEGLGLTGEEYKEPTEEESKDVSSSSKNVVELLLSASHWKDKEEAINQVSHWMSDVNHVELITTSLLESWLVVISSGLKQFTERNRNVVKAAVCNVQHIATVCGSGVAFPTRALSLFVQPMVAKFSEKALIHDLEEMYLLVAECVGPQSIASRISFAMEKTSSPAVLENAYKFLTRLVQEFSRATRTLTAMFHVHKLIDLAKHPKIGIGHRLPKVKDSSEKLILEMCRCSTDPGGMNTILPLLNDINAGRLKTLQPKMEKIAQETSLASSVAPSSSTTTSSRAVKQHPSDSSVPAASTTITIPSGVDVSAKLPSSLLKQMETENEKDAWKARMTGITTATQVFNSIHGSGVVTFNRAVHDLLQAVKKRMGDSNQKIVEKSVTLVGLIANKVGEPISRGSKIIMQPLLKLLLSNKPSAVVLVMKVLNQWVEHGGKTSSTVMDSCTPFVADALSQFVKGKKSSATAEMLSFTVNHVKACSASMCESLEAMIPYTLPALL